jgi:hypothetical protein
MRHFLQTVIGGCWGTLIAGLFVAGLVSFATLATAGLVATFAYLQLDQE